MNISLHFSPHFSIRYSSPTGLSTRPPTLDLTEALTHSVKIHPFLPRVIRLLLEQVLYAPGPVIVLFFHLHPYFSNSPALPLYCTTLPSPFVIKTLLKTQLTVFHLHQHTESTCEENRERERKESKERPADTFLRKDRNTPKELLRVSRCPE